MMFRPRWPSAGPIGGDGFAAPAGTCNFRYPVTFFAMVHSCAGHTGPSGCVVRILGRLATALTFHAVQRPSDRSAGRTAQIFST
jgi:hypothetical protein